MWRAVLALVVTHARAVPPLLHQLWLGPSVSPRCHCSAASWRAFARRYDWTHRLWRDGDVAALDIGTPPPPVFDDRATQLYKTSLTKCEILRKYGGLYVDCDLMWLGATGRAPKSDDFERFARSSDNPVVVPHSRPYDAHDLANAPLGLMGREHRHMTTLYLNTCVLGASKNDELMELLVTETIPRLLRAAVGTRNVSLDEWRVTGPEALNRAFQTSANTRPVSVLPPAWVYPYPNTRRPPPMSAARSTGVMWGELKPRKSAALYDQLPAGAPWGGGQCVWEGRAWRIK